MRLVTAWGVVLRIIHGAVSVSINAMKASARGTNNGIRRKQEAETTAPFFPTPRQRGYTTAKGFYSQGGGHGNREQTSPDVNKRHWVLITFPRNREKKIVPEAVLTCAVLCWHRIPNGDCVYGQSAVYTWYICFRG